MLIKAHQSNMKCVHAFKMQRHTVISHTYTNKIHQIIILCTIKDRCGELDYSTNKTSWCGKERAKEEDLGDNCCCIIELKTKP